MTLVTFVAFADSISSCGSSCCRSRLMATISARVIVRGATFNSSGAMSSSVGAPVPLLSPG